MNEPLLPLQKTSISDPFWSRIRETVLREGILYQWKALKNEERISFPFLHLESRRPAGALP